MREEARERRAARARGHRRVQTVTIWTTSVSILAAALLSAALAHGTAAGREQLRGPDSAPGAAGDDTRHGASGGS